MPNDSVKHDTWEKMPKEQVSPMLDRRLVTGQRLMLAHVYLKKGCMVPKHSHRNEQITYILEGELKFWIGEYESRVVPNE
jgi:quercetin dioxygenase-like cupin family protein